MVTQSQIPNIKFEAKLDNIKMFYNALRSINFHSDATFFINEHGLKAVVEESKFVQATVYIEKCIFSMFCLNSEEEFSISVNLNVITDCLSVFANLDSSVKLLYKGYGAPLVLILERHDEIDLITEVSVKTKEGEEPLEFEVNENDENYNSVIVRGTHFSNLISDFNKRTDAIEWILSPTEPFFQITAFETCMKTQIQIHRQSEVFLRFLCQKETRNQYKMSHIRLAAKALPFAHKVAIQTDSTGLLALQLMILSDRMPSNAMTKHDESIATPFIAVEYFITPLTDDAEF